MVVKRSFNVEANASNGLKKALFQYSVLKPCFNFNFREMVIFLHVKRKIYFSSRET